MRIVLALLALGFNAADNFTTYRCLNQAIPGFEVYEANPLAAWGFSLLGLEAGLWIEMGLCLVATAFLVFSRMFPRPLTTVLLVVLAVLPAGAVLNNLTVMHELGIPLFG